MTTLRAFRFFSVVLGVSAAFFAPLTLLATLEAFSFFGGFGDAMLTFAQGMLLSAFLGFCSWLAWKPERARRRAKTVVEQVRKSLAR